MTRALIASLTFAALMLTVAPAAADSARNLASTWLTSYDSTDPARRTEAIVQFGDVWDGAVMMVDCSISRIPANGDSYNTGAARVADQIRRDPARAAGLELRAYVLMQVIDMARARQCTDKQWVRPPARPNA